jgi:hypothetical protein
VRLAKIERRRADKVSDVFNKDISAVFRGKPLHRMTNHVTIQVTALAGVDLKGGDAGLADSVGIIGGLLVAFDHIAGTGFAKPLEGLHQKRGFARAGA